MKYLLAFIPPDFLHRVKDALIGKHIHGMSVSDARGFGQEHDAAHPEHHEFMGLEFSKRVRLEIICHDEEVEPVLDALRLKTGERGTAALGPPSNKPAAA